VNPANVRQSHFETGGAVIIGISCCWESHASSQLFLGQLASIQVYANRTLIRR
jgi:hypothetical protein